MGIDWRDFDFANGKTLEHAAILSVAEGKSELAKSPRPRQSQGAAVAALGGRNELHAKSQRDGNPAFIWFAALCRRHVTATGGQVTAHGYRPITNLERFCP
jgi:hypothetical protein